MAELDTVTYFCPGSCKDLATEQPRDTGEEYFGPTDDDEEEEEEEEEESLLITSSQTNVQQQDISVAKAEVKPEPGTFYSIPEACISGNDISPYAIWNQITYDNDKSLWKFAINNNRSLVMNDIVYWIATCALSIDQVERKIKPGVRNS